MSADQAEVVSQDVAVELVAKLSAEGAATDASGQSAEDGAGDRANGNAGGASNGANSRPGLTASQCSTDATSGTADRAGSSGNLHGVVEGSDFWRATAGALQ